MSNNVTLEHVEQLVEQLPPPERLKLVAHICEELSAMPTMESYEEKARRERLARVDVWLAECEKVAELWEGEFDSSADLRRIRNE